VAPTDFVRYFKRIKNACYNKFYSNSFAATSILCLAKFVMLYIRVDAIN